MWNMLNSVFFFALFPPTNPEKSFGRTATCLKPFGSLSRKVEMLGGETHTGRCGIYPGTRVEWWEKWWIYGTYPGFFGGLTFWQTNSLRTGKSPLFIGQSTNYKRPFSIAMLNYQRVIGDSSWLNWLINRIRLRSKMLPISGPLKWIYSRLVVGLVWGVFLILGDEISKNDLKLVKSIGKHRVSVGMRGFFVDQIQEQHRVLELEHVQHCSSHWLQKEAP